MASFARVSVAALAVVAAGATAAAANPAACAADEEGDGVGLLQSAGRSAMGTGHSRADPSGGWVARAATCGITESKCGTGCCELLSSCEGGTTCKSTFGGGSKDPAPAEVKCPIAFSDFGDRGCCPPASLLGPSDTCLENTCENTLEYGCGGTPGVSAGTPTCAPGGTAPAGNTVTINGKTPQPSETCTLNGKSCYKFTVLHFTSIIAPDCSTSSTSSTSSSSSSSSSTTTTTGEEDGDSSAADGGCSTGSACADASSYSTIGGTKYCCAGGGGVSVSSVNGKTTCSCS